MKNSLLIAFILIAGYVQAQFKNFSIRVSANYPTINSVNKTSTLNGVPLYFLSGLSSYQILEETVKQSFTGKVGINLDSRFDYQLTQRFFISTGLTVQSIRYQRSTTVIDQGTSTKFYISTPLDLGTPVGLHTEPTFPIRLSDELGNTTIWNLQLPLLAGTYILNKRVSVKAGPAFSYLMSARQTKLHNEGTYTVSTYEDNRRDSFNLWQTSAVVECTFYVTKHLGVDVTAQHFFTCTYAGDGYVSSGARFNTLGLGASFIF